MTSFNATDLIGASGGAAAVMLRWNKGDAEEFGKLAAGLGLPAVVCANPLLLVVSAVATARALTKAKTQGERLGVVDGAFRGAVSTGAAMGAGTMIGGPAGIIAAIVVGVVAHHQTKRVSIARTADRTAGMLARKRRRIADSIAALEEFEARHGLI